MGFQHGLSGLNAASKQLEVIGNNVANSNTIGFKQAQTQFADLFASSLSGGQSADPNGMGVKVASVTQNFAQGTLTATNNQLDIAINGKGFFRMTDPQSSGVTYTRNGQFHLDKDGFITNSGGAYLSGYMPDANGVLQTGTPVPLNINTADQPPASTGKVEAVVNLDSRGSAFAAAAFDPNDPTTYNSATSTAIYDSLGNSHVMQAYFMKTASNTWNVYASVDGTMVGAAPVGVLNFTPAGAINTVTTTLPFTVPVAVATGATTPFNVKLDLTGSTQFGSNFSVASLSQDGFASGRLSGFGIDEQGMITGRYTNGRSANLGQVALANFTNPNGLISIGNNAWADSSASGPALVGAPGSGSMGVLQSSAVEESNVDLTAELVEMITAQRAYQANAQTIKTMDQIMQTAVNLR